jgi:sialate O-acetylesterase
MMRSKKTVFLALILSFGVSAACFAEVRPANIFGSGMVLQREIPLEVWGTADPGERVTVTFNGKNVSDRADKEGRWSVTLPALPASSVAATMTFAGKSSKVELDNILVGDVWLCSGQSNMEWTLRRTRDAEKEIAAADYPLIRCFTVQKNISMTPRDEFAGSWEVSSPQTAGNFTAVGYFFARELWNELKVPIGIINSSWGGTGVETWTSPTAYAALPADVRTDYNIAQGATPSNPNQFSSLLYNGMINPMIDYKIKGAIWYQGENNAGKAYDYRTLFPAMINDWRAKWGYEFPFYWVQLANFMAVDATPVDSEWAELREAQTMTASLPRTGQAVITDIGDARDIHPRNKQDVGRRLALQALHDTYKKEGIVWSGPTLLSMSVDGNRATVEFETYGSELAVHNKYGYVEGFAIAGVDKVFHWAQAAVTRDGKVVVWSREVSRPVAVRYAWGNNPEANLFNAEGLPAAPFRTDEWPGITAGR